MNIKQTFLSLKIRNFRLYFFGQALSLIGTWMQTIGQDWLVLKLTNSGTQLGIVSALQFLPILFLGPWGGSISDRFEKRKILYFTQAASAILALTLGILVAINQINIWAVYALALALGFVTVVDSPARQTFVPEMVKKENMTNAITLNSTEVNVARALGPVVSGGIIAYVGLAPCFIINAVSYIPVIITLWMMNAKELNMAPRITAAKGRIKEGLAYVKSSPVLFYTLIMMAIIGMLSYEFSVALPLMAKFTFSGNAATYSILIGASGFGSVLGGLYASGRRRINPGILIFSALMFGIALTIASFMPSVLLTAVAMFFAGIFSVNFLSLSSALLQTESVPEMRGRVMGLWSVAFLGTTPIGAPIIGVIGEYVGPRWALATGGIAAIIGAWVGAWGLMRKNKPLKTSSIEAVAEESTKIP